MNGVAYPFAEQCYRLSIRPQTFPDFLVIRRNGHSPQPRPPFQLLESDRILLTFPLIILSSELVGVVDRCESLARFLTGSIHPKSSEALLDTY